MRLHGDDSSDDETHLILHLATLPPRGDMIEIAVHDTGVISVQLTDARPLLPPSRHPRRSIKVADEVTQSRIIHYAEEHGFVVGAGVDRQSWKAKKMKRSRPIGREVPLRADTGVRAQLERVQDGRGVYRTSIRRT